jgi:hypothetical protein
LKCDSKQLEQLIQKYAADPEAELMQLTQHGRAFEELPGKREALRLRHEVESWRLIQALWGYIEGEHDALSGQLRRGTTSGAVADETEEGDSDCDLLLGSQAVLAGFRRRRALSLWLCRQAKALTEAELDIVSEPSEAVLRLMCANQIAPAVAIAVAAGDGRLATILVQAGCGTRNQGFTKEVQEQLAVWQANDMLGHIDKDRLLVYKLLAGQVCTFIT